MKKFFCLSIPILIILFFLGATSARANNSYVELKSISPERVEAQPGKVVTLSLVVVNHSGIAANFSETLELPADWQVIIPTTSFILGAHDQQVRLVSLLIPVNSPAGSYQINYFITSEDAKRDTYQVSVNVEVAAVSVIESLIEEKPQIVVAGEEYTVRLRYMNKGNSEVTLNFELKNSPLYPLEFAPAEMLLPPGKSEILTVTVKTDKKTTSAIKHIVSVKALDKKVTCQSDTIVIDVIPSIVGDYGFYHRIPSQFEIITGGDKPRRDDPIDSVFQLRFSGSGSIDEQGKHRVYWSFLTPDLVGVSHNLNNPGNEFGYASDLLDLNIGSKNMILSTLTKRWSGYDNIKIGFHPWNHSFGIINPGEKEQGIYYGYQITPWFGMKANYLHSNDHLADNDLYSLQAEIKPLSNTTLNLEYALDSGLESDSTAYRVNLRGYVRNHLHYSLEKVLARPDFNGNYHDLESINGTVSFFAYNKLQTSFSYHNYQNNLDLDSAKEVARDEQTLLANLFYYLTPQAAVLLSLRDAQKIDRLSPADYNNEERLAKLGLQHQFPNWRFLASIGAGEYDDKLDPNDITGFKTYTLNVNYTPNTNQTYLFFVNTGDQNYSLIPEADQKIGVKANLHLRENCDLKLEYQRRNFLDLLTSGQDYFSLSFSYTINQLSLSVKGVQLFGGNYTDSRWSLLATYMFPCNIPTAKRREVSVVKGRVFNGEKPGESPIPNVVVKANSMTAVTNEEGEFIFSALPPGVYSISLDKSRVDLDLAPMEKLPRIVEVKKGETAELRIGMVSASEIIGKTVRITPDQEESGDLYVSKESVYSLETDEKFADDPLSSDEAKKTIVLANTLIELTDGEETFRQVTNSKGEFSFAQMRPGRWTLKAYDNSVPAHFYFEIAETTLELEPGERKEITFRAIPRIRSIQIVEEGRIGPEGTVVETDRRLALDDLFTPEYYSSAKPVKSPRASLEQAGLLRKNYLYRDQYFTDTIYIVKKGDTLTGIADKFKVSLQRVIDLNYLGTTGMIKENSVLIIPIPIEFIHVVKPRETLEEIARRYGVTVEILADLNSISADERLEAGESLVLPGR